MNSCATSGCSGSYQTPSLSCRTGCGHARLVQMMLYPFYSGTWRAQCQVPRLHWFVCIQKFAFSIVIIHLASNNIATYCVVFLCGGLWNKIILAHGQTHPSLQLSTVGSTTAKARRNGSVQTVRKGCHFGTCWLRL